MSENIIEHSQEIIVKTFVPDTYIDRIDKNNEGSNNIFDLDSKPTGIYRFYGIFVDSKHKVGYIKYHILYDSSTIEIDWFKTDDSYQRAGYGTILLKQSLTDLVKDFPHIKEVIVCSTAYAIPFYIKNDFKPYLGDNNLIKTLERKH